MSPVPGAPPARVLHVLKYYRPAFTGEGVFLERSSAVMQELAPGVAHELLVTHTPRPEDPAAHAACHSLARVTYLSGRPLGAAALHARLALWFAANLRRFDVVHFRTHADWYGLTYLMAKLARRRLVLSATLDDSLPVLVSRYRPRLQGVARRTFSLFDAYVSISPKLLAETRELAPEARCHLVPCGITVPPSPPGRREAVRETLGAAEAEPVLLFVGGLCARKDPLALVEALPAIRAAAPGTRLALVGPELEPDYVARLRARTAELGLGGAVAFLGERRDPHPFFDAADALAFASRLEGFGTVVPEAMAHGLPVVARRLPGVNEDFVLEGETGFLFDDQAGLERGAARLAADASLRARLGEAGRRLARARFGMRGIAHTYLSIYGLGDRAAEPDRMPEGSAAETGLGADASIFDRRFHTPFAAAAAQPPLLLTMVDAEEEFDWHRPFSRQALGVGSMAAQRLAHRVFERHGVVPTYLTDYAVVSQALGRGPLQELVRQGAAEVGAQMHPWITPPFEEEVSERNSYSGNLPLPLELEKARRLTAALEEAFGERPRIWRTGRYGAGPRTADILKALGYAVDTSVVPFWPPEGCRQPGAWRLNAKPFWLDRDRTLLEIPVSGALVGRLAGQAGQRLAPALFHPASERLGLPGAAARLGLLERIRLSPEGMTIGEAKRLARRMRAAGHGVFVLTYHSPSLEPGHTPYVRSADDVIRLLDWLDEFYQFFREELGGRPASWREVRFGAGPAAAAVPRLGAVPA